MPLCVPPESATRSGCRRYNGVPQWPASCTLPDVDVTRAEHQLQLIADVRATCQSIGAPVWLRGGWAMDFFLGRVTRDHVDIDWFAGAVNAPGIISALAGRGYRVVPGPPADQQVDLSKEGEDLELRLAVRRRHRPGGSRWRPMGR